MFRWIRLVLLSGALAELALSAVEVRRIGVVRPAHPAIESAARLLARSFALSDAAIVAVPALYEPGAGELLLTTNPPPAAPDGRSGDAPRSLDADGYAVLVSGGAVRVHGQRPRALLFAAGDVNHWRRLEEEGEFRRAPAFAFRSAALHGRMELAEYVAALGVNVIIGRSDSPVTLRETLPAVYRELTAADRSEVEREAARAVEAHRRLAEACQAADVAYYPLLYGNDFRRWSPALYAAAVKAFPTAAGTDARVSWEKGSLCPSDSQARALIEAYVGEFLRASGGDGLCATFWDHYGLHCQCPRCVASGLNRFPDQLKICVASYHAAAKAAGRPLVVRTWSSGVPHWLLDEWVHAPGNGGPSGEGVDLWVRVIRELPPEILLQTKVYQADCQPDPPFSELLGRAAPQGEVAEHQITGQTTGRFYLPASTVEHTAWTLRRSHELVGESGGVSLFPGGTQNPRYDLLADIVNSINVYAWRELAWNPQASVERIWLDWATPIYGEQAAPMVIRALRRSELVVNRLFSALGLGNDTNSGFAKTVARRETLLKYTNRYFRPEGQAALAPTIENVDRVIAEKEDCLRQIEAMRQDIEAAGPHLKPGQLAELRTRLDWLWEFAQVTRHLDESLWRYRYLRHCSALLTTDARQMQYLARSYDAVREHYRRMFKFDPAQQFACYDRRLGELPSKPSLGSPLPLMDEIYQQSRACVEEALGPQGVPTEWVRGPKSPASPAKGNP
jgi:hypothetical protein